MGRLSIKEKHMIDKLLSYGKISNYYVGSGQHTSKSEDYVRFTKDVLNSIGLEENTHYTHGNRAPKGGWSGWYLDLTADGKKYFEELTTIVKENLETEDAKKIRAGMFNIIDSIRRLNP